MITSLFIASGRTRSLAGAALAAALAVGVVGGCSTQEVFSSNPRSRAQGIKAFEAGQYTDAAASFREALRSDPRDYRSQFYLAQSYEKLGQTQQAIQAYKASLDAQPRTLAGQEDKAQRLRTIEALAQCISKSDTRDAEINALEQQARAGHPTQDYLLLAKIFQARGDADSALDAYNRATLRKPDDFVLRKEYGLYLEQLGQKPKATLELQKAYAINSGDPEVNDALRRIGVVPGPSLKSEDQLAKPPIPQGPLPEVDLSTFHLGGSQPAQQQPAPQQAAAPAEPAPPSAEPAAPAATFTPPPPTSGSQPAPGQPRD